MLRNLCLVLFVSLAVVWWWYEGFESETDSVQNSLSGPEFMVLNGSRERFNASGNRTEQIHFEQLKSLSSNEFQLNQVRYQLQDEAGNYWTLSAPIASQNQNLWQLEQNVNITKNEPNHQLLFSFETSSVFFRTDTQDIWTNQTIRMQGRGFNLQALGATGNLGQGALKLTQQVQTQYEMDH